MVDPFTGQLILAGGSALASAGLNYLAGKTARKGKYTRQSLYSDEQNNRSNAVGNQGLKQLQNPYEGFEPIAQQARNQFYQQTIPSLSERFTSMGSYGGSNALSSPSFQQTLGSAGADMNTDLAAMQAQYGQQNQQNALQMLQFGGQPQFENVYEHGGDTALSGAAGQLGQGFGNFAQQGFGQMFQNYLNKPPQDTAGTALANMRKPSVQSFQNQQGRYQNQQDSMMPMQPNNMPNQSAYMPMSKLGGKYNNMIGY